MSWWAMKAAYRWLNGATFSRRALSQSDRPPSADAGVVIATVIPHFFCNDPAVALSPCCSRNHDFSTPKGVRSRLTFFFKRAANTIQSASA